MTKRSEELTAFLGWKESRDKMIHGAYVCLLPNSSSRVIVVAKNKLVFEFIAPVHTLTHTTTVFP